MAARAEQAIEDARLLSLRRAAQQGAEAERAAECASLAASLAAAEARGAEALLRAERAEQRCAATEERANAAEAQLQVTVAEKCRDAVAIVRSELEPALVQSKRKAAEAVQARDSATKALNEARQVGERNAERARVLENRLRTQVRTEHRRLRAATEPLERRAAAARSRSDGMERALGGSAEVELQLRTQLDTAHAEIKALRKKLRYEERARKRAEHLRRAAEGEAAAVRDEVGALVDRHVASVVQLNASAARKADAAATVRTALAKELVATRAELEVVTGESASTRRVSSLLGQGTTRVSDGGRGRKSSVAALQRSQLDELGTLEDEMTGTDMASMTAELVSLAAAEPMSPVMPRWSSPSPESMTVREGDTSCWPPQPPT